MKLLNLIKENKNIYRHCVISFIISWCLLVTGVWLVYGSGYSALDESVALTGAVDFAIYMVLLVVLWAASLGFVLWLDSPRLELMLMYIMVCMSCLTVAFFNKNVYAGLMLAGLMVLAFTYCEKCINVHISINATAMWIIVAIAAAIVGIYTALFSAFRYYTYSMPNFDGGLFAQMFYYMKNHLTMQTTLERDTLMSHMWVHASPVFWLMLPAYAVVSSPATIQVMQVVVLIVAVFPLVLLVRKMGFSRFNAALIGVLYCFYPVIAGGCGYDVHENCFLPLGIILVLYSFYCDSKWLTVISYVLLLGVKEDAAIYAVFIGLFFLLSGKDRKQRVKALILIGVSLLYFVVAVAAISSHGYQVSMTRFNNMDYTGEGSMIMMIKTMILNPGYLVTQLMNPDNVEFIVIVLAPLLFIPVLARDIRLYVLMGPLVLFNLMQDYKYAHDIKFQYVFGSGTLLLFIMLVCLKRKKEKGELNNASQAAMLIKMCTIAIVLFITLFTSRSSYITRAFKPNYQRVYASLDKGLSMIPQDASVRASTFLCAHICERDELYEDAYTERLTDYIALDLRGSGEGVALKEKWENEGYETVYFDETAILVLRKLD